MKRPSPKECRELMALLVEFDGCSKASAKANVSSLTNDSLSLMLNVYRRKKLERDGQMGFSYPDPPELPETPPEAPQRAKKTPYTLLLPPEQLAALRALSEDDGASVSHHIRQAIRLYLRKR